MTDMSKHMRKVLSDVPTLKVFDFSQYVSKIPGIIKFTIGEPDFDTPADVKEAAIKSIENNRTHYAPQRGTTGLLTAIADTLAKKYGLHYDPKTEILVTNGVTEGIYSALTAIINPGDVVLVPTPTFSIYSPDVMIAGGVPVEVDTSATNFKLTPELLHKYLTKYGDRVKGLILVNPSNPTGIAYRQDEINELAELLKNKPIFTICDEIYSELNYDGEYSSMAKVLPEQTILANGLSKSYAMTGWRIGYLCAPAKVTSLIFKVHAFAVTDIATFVQDAAEAALRDGDKATRQMDQQYIKRRDYMYRRLTEMGFDCTQPMGAFYIFAKIPPFLNQDDNELIYQLANEAKVAVTAGSNFGRGGEGYLRFSYATSLEQIKEGMDRLARFCEQAKNKK
ncbi:aminotransferase class I/II-fold pyridoxal phosphate-dependent enzyme [Limosilactobacillus sp. STM2_1]|uniref:Aminotransferase n=1 Tax=Limosilactobacillus rudii TaxID=2759755 RepID=A0A7W3YML0_9LACO|nr:aminotransferase class I/II-fold pyridoxal phosphate-dependent enzyme [Limosilactobacillus rudii]MBB1080135.1 aminotransferase class I/II-fold pyridoxal phosphate-dependent enzyme [Limosilactobacillus rudii]MBB1096377.1 aminotransferase class I/II-fold pyridoxal phosphate-dependent enzyme [Limosilactobacillus rudii]MCD7133622.1 aminotransferase class I/II-fold pyridoxal phosphate-dependent enzyme [Limosilactobacillus rudii]